MDLFQKPENEYTLCIRYINMCNIYGFETLILRRSKEPKWVIFKGKFLGKL